MPPDAGPLPCPADGANFGAVADARLRYDDRTGLLHSPCASKMRRAPLGAGQPCISRVNPNEFRFGDGRSHFRQPWHAVLDATLRCYLVATVRESFPYPRQSRARALSIVHRYCSRLHFDAVAYEIGDSRLKRSGKRTEQSVACFVSIVTTIHDLTT